MHQDLADRSRANRMREVEAAEQLLHWLVELPGQHLRHTARGHGRHVIVEFPADKTPSTQKNVHETHHTHHARHEV